MSRLSRLAPLTLTLAVLASACSDSSINAPKHTQQTTPIGTGSGFTLLLTDAPGDFKAAVVTISKITLQGTGGSVTLLDHPITVDLLQLQNEVATIVRGLNIPAGSFSEMRLILSGGFIEVETSHGNEVFATPGFPLPTGLTATGVLMMPSMGQSGLKIDLPGGKLDVGPGETIVMIDFNAHDSFGHEAGNSGRWIMHPVIKATNVTFGGNVEAQLQLGQGVTLPVLNGDTLTLADFAAVLTPAGGGAADTLPLTLVNGVFQALFKGLVPGSYLLSFVSPAGLLDSFSPTLPIPVTVVQKMTTTQLVTLTSAALPGTIVATLGLAAGVTLPSIGTPPAPVTLGMFKATLAPAVGKVDTVTFALSGATFQATFPNLVPGTYSLNVLSPAGITPTYSPTLPVSVPLTSGATVTQAISITKVTAP